MEEIAEVYSRSLFEVASEHDVLDRVRDELGEFADALDESRDLQIFFFSPYFSSQEKKEGIEQAVTEADEHFVHFLELLAERHRLPAIFRIRREYDRMWSEENKLVAVSVTTAVKLDQQIVEDIGKRIEEQTGKRIELSSTVDPGIVGGLVLQVGNMVMDASLKARLERLRKQVARGA
ncbi:MAG: ATP synthase F1 subunit delta [Thermoleophilaceae bacterium]|nr:ATP synthase F1 subunit delta [Thermoleophilaceae bacterium]